MDAERLNAAARHYVLWAVRGSQAKTDQSVTYALGKAAAVIDALADEGYCDWDRFGELVEAWRARLIPGVVSW